MESQGPAEDREGDFSATLARAQCGDAEAVAALYGRYSQTVRDAVRSRLPKALRSKYDTADFSQSVFAEVIRQLPRLTDRGERAFVALLRLKAQNKVRERIRHHLGRKGDRAEARVATGAEPPARGTDAARVAERLEEAVRLHHLLEQLDPESREVVQLRSAGKRFAQIAEALGLPSEDAARKRYGRALVALRRLWEPRKADSRSPRGRARQ